jgi:hypothetical protein
MTQNGHPEGVYGSLNFLDYSHWPLDKYAACLHNESLLNYCIAQAHREASLREKSEDEAGCEKWTLRYRGLELLRDVDNGLG